MFDSESHTSELGADGVDCGTEDSQWWKRTSLDSLLVSLVQTKTVGHCDSSV